MAAIEVRNLVKRFGDFTAVNGVSFTVQTGEIFGLLGPNGAGKSTLIRMLTTLLPPTSGTALVNGYDVVSQQDAVRTSIGVIPQALTSDTELSGSSDTRSPSAVSTVTANAWAPSPAGTLPAKTTSPAAHVLTRSPAAAEMSRPLCTFVEPSEARYVAPKGSTRAPSTGHGHPCPAAAGEAITRASATRTAATPKSFREDMPLPPSTRARVEGERQRVTSNRPRP
jgi:ABC-type oligopeptide transport system ATPase subunit